MTMRQRKRQYHSKYKCIEGGHLFVVAFNSTYYRRAKK